MSRARYVHRVATGGPKECVTFLGTYNANGESVTPTLVLPYLRTPADVARSVPSDWLMAKNTSGERFIFLQSRQFFFEY